MSGLTVLSAPVGTGSGFGIGGSATGLIPLPTQYIWVDSMAGSTNGVLNDRSRPFSTLKQALTAITNNGGAQISIRSGVYYVTNIWEGNGGSTAPTPGVLIGNLTNVAIVGTGNTYIVGANPAGDLITVTNSSGIYFEGIRFGWLVRPDTNLWSLNPTKGLWGCVDVRWNNSAIEFNRCVFFNSRDHGVGTFRDDTQGLPYHNCYGFTVRNCEFYNIGNYYDPSAAFGDGHCVTIVNMSDVLVEDCYMHNFERNGVEIFEFAPPIGSSGSSVNIRIKRCRFVAGQECGVKILSNWQIPDKYTDITIEDCIFEDFNNDNSVPSIITKGIQVDPSVRVVVKNNTICRIRQGGTTTNGSAGILLTGYVRNSDFIHNTIYQCGNGIACGTVNSITDGPPFANRFSWNNIFSNGVHGIQLSGFYNEVSHNRIFDNNDGSSAANQWRGAGIYIAGTTFSNSITGSGSITSSSNYIANNFIFSSPGKSPVGNNSQFTGISVNGDYNTLEDNFIPTPNVNSTYVNSSFATNTQIRGFSGPLKINSLLNDSASITTSGSDQSFSPVITVQARTLDLAKPYHVIASGSYGSAASPGTVNFKLKNGSTTLIDFGTNSLPASMTNLAWRVKADITTRIDSGAGANLSGSYTLDVGTNTISRIHAGNNVLKLDSNSNASLTLTVLLSSAGNTFKLEEFYIEP